MKVEKPKKLTKQQIRKEESDARWKSFLEKAKWTPAVHKLAAARAESNRLDRYIAFKERWRKGDIYEDSDSSTASDEIARVCESPEKKDKSEEQESNLEQKRTEAAKKRFFPAKPPVPHTKSFNILAPDTMELALPDEKPESEGIFLVTSFYYECHKCII